MIPNTSTEDLFTQGKSAYQAGQYQEAISSLQTVLQHNPTHGDALSLLATIYFRAEMYQDAATLLEKFITICPNDESGWYQLAISYIRLNQLQNAENTLTKGIDLSNVTWVLWATLIDLHLTQNNVECAIEVGEHAVNKLAANPHPAPLCNLGNAFIRAKNYSRAIDVLETAKQMDPHNLAILGNLALAATKDNNWLQAKEYYQQALTLAPSSFEIHSNYAIALRDHGDLEQARIIMEKALAIRPNQYAEKFYFADLLYETGEFDKSIEQYNEVISSNSPDVDMHKVHFGLSFSLLITGNYQQGWREYQWRDLSITLNHYQPRFPDVPLWRGETLNNKILLVIAEQGYGDTLQFARYLEQLQLKQPKAIYFCVPPELASLLGKSFDNIGILIDFNDIPHHDYYVHLLQIPEIEKTELTNIPNRIPYLKTFKTDRDYWKQELAQYAGIKVGVVWKGDPNNVSDYKRSIPYNIISILFELRDIQFITLQIDRNKMEKLPANVIDLTNQLTDFAKTAALIENLDLVITPCTAVAHLAGALGKPTWILLAHVPDWRWGTTGSSSPWYSTVRLFRQTQRAQWETVVDNVKSCLKSEYDIESP